MSSEIEGLGGDHAFRYKLPDSLYLIVQLLAQLRRFEHPLVPVSYTHLDVYKRQP